MYAFARKCIKLKPPAKGWGKKPSVSDTNTADDIERTHSYRNQICHMHNFEMTTQDFNEDTMDLTGAILRLSDDDEQIQTEIVEILNRKIVKGKVLEQIKEIATFQEEAKKEDINIEESGIMKTKDYSLECNEKSEEFIKTPSTEFSTLGSSLKPENPDTVRLTSNNMNNSENLEAGAVSSNVGLSRLSGESSTQTEKYM
uniref:Uncharacterized protein LOC111107392 n=1 Tax=Crassostrea virginica TaxID=6565 RepID=A0A8B8B4E5_CRAVI|nr:uncharacterized protein LOC111107392 [Crassostrea virginica]